MFVDKAEARRIRREALADLKPRKRREKVKDYNFGISKAEVAYIRRQARA